MLLLNKKANKHLLNSVLFDCISNFFYFQLVFTKFNSTNPFFEFFENFTVLYLCMHAYINKIQYFALQISTKAIIFDSKNSHQLNFENGCDSLQIYFYQSQQSFAVRN